MTTQPTDEKPRKCSWWRGHNWSKWKQYEMSGTATYLFSSIPVPFSKIIQKRECVDCGYAQQEEIKI